MSHRSITIEKLQHQLKSCRGAFASTDKNASRILSTGLESLDAILPQRGLRAGSLWEWLGETGAGCESLALLSMAAHLQENGSWCLIPARRNVYAYRAAIECAVQQCFLVKTRTDEEAWWAVEQALRCRSLVTWHWADNVPERVLRRWQLAAESGGGLGILFRPLEVRRQSSWADLRLMVTPLTDQSGTGWTLRIDVLYCRGGLGGQSLLLELNHATGAVHLVSELADSTATSRTARA